jgi:two-component system chemotaxis response regulator CheB
VVIAASTGGPAALQKVLTALPANFPYPILLVQHMPKTFTQVFAERLNQQCHISVKEAEDGDRLQPGRALLAPGGLQMIIDSKQTDRVRILPGDERLTYKPSADVTYASAAKTYGAKVLGITLTGMGADGCDGSRLLKQAGSTQWAQNRESCTIYGMPQAVINAGLADAILDLDDIGPLLAGRGSR